MSFASVKEILDAHNYNALIGLREDPWLEVKRVPYNLNAPDGRYELAKDVSAFANAGGGIIIVGLQTEPDEDLLQAEKILALAPCASADFQTHRYTSILHEYIHPSIQNLRVYLAPTNNEGTQGLGIIEVPAQNADRQYYLITKVVESGAMMKQIVFGLVRRNDTSNEPFTPAQLYRYTQDGKSPTAQMLTRINEKLDALLLNSRQPPEEVDPEDFYGQRTAEILDELEP